jgi:ArsR family transcriptional regulator
MAVLEITQSKASRHLAALRHIGIASDRREGLWSYYSLCIVEDELAKEHLKLLQATLAKRPEAKQLLNKLNVWLKAKKHGASCLPNKRPPRSDAKSKTGSFRASRTGKTR